MTDQDAPAQPGDDELIAAVRSGDLSSYGLLFSRHQEAAHRLARQLTRGGADADDLVAGSFEKVMDQLRAGKGPDVAFRAYLLTAMRRLHVDGIRAVSKVRPTEDADLDRGVDFDDAPLAAFEQGTAAAAFASLPERWQTVLWHLDVEGEKPAAVAPILGMSANSVSALAYRAREGLRQAYLQQHLREEADDAHQWAIGNLGAYVRKGLSRRDQAKVREHLDGCARCTAVYLELSEVNSDLGAIVAPAVLGAAAAGYLGGGGSTAMAVLGGWWSSTRGWVAGSTTHTVAAVAGAAAVATLAGGLVFVAVTGGADDVASTPSSQSDGDGSSGDASGPDSQAPGTTPGLPGATPPGTSPSALPPTLPGATPPGSTPAPDTSGQGGSPGSSDGSPSDDGSGDGSGDGSADGSGDGSGDGATGDGQGSPDPTSPGDPDLGASGSVSASVGDDAITVTWDAVPRARGYDVYRSAAPQAGAGRFGVRAALATDAAATLVNTDGPLTRRSLDDEPVDAGSYVYTVRAVRGDELGPGTSQTARDWQGRLVGRGAVRTTVTGGGSSLCLGASGGRLALVACADSPAVVLRGGMIRVGDRCAAADGDVVELRSCDPASAAQRWSLRAAEPAGTRVVAASGLVLRQSGDSLVLVTASTSSKPRETRPERFRVPGRDGVDPGVPESDDPPLTAPANVFLAAKGDAVTVTWTGVDDPDGYVVRRDGTAVSGRLADGATSFTDSSVPDGLHVYTVTAVRDDDTRTSDEVEVAVGRTRYGVLRFHDDYAGGAWCVDASGGVSVQRCAGATMWSFYADGTIRDGRLCLLAPGRDVTLGSCEGATTWADSVAPRFGGVFLVADRRDVLDANGGIVRAGVDLIAYPAKRDPTSAPGNDNQRFTLPGRVDAPSDTR
ncbi:sigma-70 family RNA polymerase sigma factor [Solicola sp. PLA-1-18]|uniref:sigma-70 family RNA polymerase sigma factor n=1 Tax=Solicola sp. PLA-1-18 TaxID=3380532 RepID=UPI003B817D44